MFWDNQTEVVVKLWEKLQEPMKVFEKEILTQERNRIIMKLKDKFWNKENINLEDVIDIVKWKEIEVWENQTSLF